MRNGLSGRMEKIKYHTSFNFPPQLYKEFTNKMKDWLCEEWVSYKRKRNTISDDEPRYIKEMRIMASIISELSQNQNLSPNLSRNSQVSKVTMGTMFGGHNDQQAFKKTGNKWHHGEAEHNWVSATNRVHQRVESIYKRNDLKPGTTAWNECDTNACTCCLDRTLLHSITPKGLPMFTHLTKPSLPPRT